MDLLTQGLLGACSASTAANPQQLRRAALIGFIAGLAADVDILIASDNDPLLNLEFHRHFTHSILFVPLAALLIAALLWPLNKSRLSFGKTYLLAFLGYLPSGFLDACTSYGTHLFWPLSDQRISLNIISIVDPIFTLVLLTGLLWALIGRNKLPLIMALLFVLFYLGLGFSQRQSVAEQAIALAQSRNHDANMVLVKPTLGNLLLWRSVYRHEDRFYVDALRVNPLTGQTRLYPGKSVKVFDTAANPLQLPQDSVLFEDIQRFAYFSDQYLAQHPNDPTLIIDVRYANLPNQTAPLWGIVIDPDQPQQHARFEHFRDSSRETRSRFIDMVLGNE